MDLNRIIIQLSAQSADTTEAARLARSGFLAWCLTRSDSVPLAQEARAGLARLHYFVSDSAALAEFQQLLFEVSDHRRMAAHRSARRRARRLH